MDRFKFRPPSTSALSRGPNQTTNWSEKSKNGTEPKNSKKSNDDDDDLWNDEIDEMTLLQASQIGDTVEKPRRQDRLDVDPATLAKMFPAQHEEDDEIWNSDKPNHPKGKFNQTQTIFGDDSRHPTIGKPVAAGFQSSFDEPMKKPVAFKQLGKPMAQRIVATSAYAANPAVDSLTQNANSRSSEEEMEKIKTENRKLLQLHYSKTGEVSYLRSEMMKRAANHEKEKQALAQALEDKNRQLKEAERTRARDFEAVKADRDFNKRELEQAIEMIEKLRRQKVNDNEASQQTQSNHSPSTKRPSLDLALPRLTKKPKLASNIDESFFEEGVKVVKCLKRPTKEMSVQTVSKQFRLNDLKLLKQGADIVSQLTSLAGSMSLITLAASDVNIDLLNVDPNIAPTLDIALSLERGVSIGRCFSLFCASVVTHHSKFERVVARNRRKNASGVEVDEEQQLLDRILTDLKGARVIASMMFENETSSVLFPEIDFEALTAIVRILIHPLTMEYKNMVESTATLLSTFFETGTGCITNERVRDILNEIKTNGFELEVLDDPNVAQSNVETLINYLGLLKSLSLHHAHYLCSNSKDSCEIYFLWTIIEHMIFGQEKSDKNKCRVMNLAKAFLAFLNSVLPTDISWVGFSKVRKNQVATESTIARSVTNGGADSTVAKEDSKSECIVAKCKWCSSDILKSLAAITWSVVAEYTDLKTKGSAPQLEALDLAHACLTCLHLIWSWDPALFPRALGEHRGIQRRYIWTLLKLNQMKPLLNLGSLEATILTDLSVDCEEVTPCPSKENLSSRISSHRSNSISSHRSSSSSHHRSSKSHKRK